jgi:hypothetical protein
MVSGHCRPVHVPSPALDTPDGRFRAKGGSMSRSLYWFMGAAVLAVTFGSNALAQGGGSSIGRAKALARVGSCGARSLLGGGPQLTFVGLTADQRLVVFGECNPGRPRDLGPITGLSGPDSALIGIDYRVQNGLLYGVGNGGGVYRFDTPNVPAATLVNRLSMPLDPTATSFGVDFNPAADRLRIIANTGQNLRHNVNDGGTTLVDGMLNYIEGTPPAPVLATGVTGAAYTNNDLDADTSTTLFDIDTTLDEVAIQSPPNNGSLVATGLLNVDADAMVGFDIYTQLRKGMAAANNAFATLVVGGRTGFYRVNLLAGTATLIDNFSRDKTDDFSDPVIDIAIPLKQ